MNQKGIVAYYLFALMISWGTFIALSPSAPMTSCKAFVAHSSFAPMISWGAFKDREREKDRDRESGGVLRKTGVGEGRRNI